MLPCGAVSCIEQKHPNSDRLQANTPDPRPIAARPATLNSAKTMRATPLYQW
jgi:hypothetical protein